MWKDRIRPCSSIACFPCFLWMRLPGGLQSKRQYQAVQLIVKWYGSTKSIFCIRWRYGGGTRWYPRGYCKVHLQSLRQKETYLYQWGEIADLFEQSQMKRRTRASWMWSPWKEVLCHHVHESCRKKSLALPLLRLGGCLPQSNFRSRCHPKTTDGC